ncbi:filamentous hemagglutinin N-terminal domain-containing protein [Nostoc sphaeroides CHAB 2801]|uniref:two-partner secretion domain-containing protein n=1 Tax=Nostoc sphaeroides TaxID=446679 RepID=UPI000E4C3B49|nr:filamentous hemagglutinin N-terminal domain-containing protein [Nostoc sphaeroides]MCC5628816.1 filamentous hemagglutinin N-terminal domain-containing protein [Nostoc sphaeroides CHAB 2801]
MRIASILCLCLISTAFSQALPARAEIIPDNTLGAETSQLNQNKIEGGAVRGSNLFHSFSEFNIPNGGRVDFINPTGIENIFTRVTGGNASNIEGTLGVLGTANLFLINPNGIVFGKNARLDVKGSFVGTTANGVQFGNQGIFSATNPQAPPLLTVNPSALWFNQLNQNAEIKNNSVVPSGKDPTDFDAFGLKVGDGKSLLLVGGNVSMEGGGLNAYGGRVELGGLAEPGNVNLLLNGDNLSLKFPLNVTRGSVSLTNQARVYVEAAGGGDIAINAHNINILGGSLLSAGIADSSETVAGDITLNATEDIKVASFDSNISRIRNRVNKGLKGNGGNIFINARDFSLDDARVAAFTSGQGNVGNVTVRALDAVNLSNSDILSSVEPGGKGKAGNIDINAATLSLRDGAQLLTIIRKAPDNQSTQAAGQGDAGNINIKVTDAVDITGKKMNFLSGIQTTVGKGTVGNGGNITIDSGSFSLRDGAQLAASTSGQGNAGNVTVRAKNAVDLAGYPTAIFSSVERGGVGQGGNIDINAATLSLRDGAQLVTIIREALDNQSTQAAGRGNAGNVNVLVTGAVHITGVKNVDIPGVKQDSPSGINSSVLKGTEGNGGKIFIDSGDFYLSDGALIETSSSGQGKAGNIEINSPKITLDNQAKLNAESASGNGGNINFVNNDLLLLRHGAQISTNAGTAEKSGDGGNININSKFIVAIPEENSDISANAYTGTGGNIQIKSQGIFGIESRPESTDKSDITASSKFGVNGVININVPDTSSIQNSFTQFSPNVLDTNALIANSCISRGIKGQENSFRITGSGALTTNRPGVAVSTYTTGEVRGVEPTSRPWKKGDPIIEPQGVFRLPNGQLILSRGC